jgi:pimeloyl-ACP methyl ester carboxylesterase
MSDSPTITRVDLEDVRSLNALEAEKRLFAYYELDYKTHFIEISEPDLRVRVFEVGDGPPLMLVPGGSGDVGLGAGLMSALDGWRIIAVNRPGGDLSDGIDHRQIDVQQPVKYIWGENDPYGDLDVARQAARITPQAELHELATGHLPLFDKPQVTGCLIKEFLSMEIL